MNSYIYLETGVLFLFLMMVAWTQAARSKLPGYYSRNPGYQIAGLMIVFALLSLGLGVALSSVSPMFGIALAAGITLSLMHPANALSLFVMMLFLRPWEILDANPFLNALPRLLAAVCFISWLLYPAQCGKPTNKTKQVLLILLVFSFWLFLTTFRVPDSSSAQMDWFNIFFKSVIVFVMCLFLIDDELSVAELKRTLVISSFALVVLGIYKYQTMPDKSNRLQFVGMLGDSNDLAAGIVIALPLALAPVFKRLSNIFQRMTGVIFAGVSLLAIWYTQSRGAMLAFLTEGLAFGTFYKKRGRSLRMLLMAGFLGLGYIFVLRAISRSTEEMSASQESRLIYWKAAINMTLHHMVWGVGFEQYPANYESYASALKYEWGQRTAHSSWLLAFAESGLVGGILFIAFFISVWRIAWAQLRASPDLFYALAGYSVAMSFLSHTYMLYPYLLSGIILASGAIRERSLYE